MIPANCKCHNPVHHCCLKKWILEVTFTDPACRFEACLFVQDCTVRTSWSLLRVVWVGGWVLMYMLVEASVAQL